MANRSPTITKTTDTQSVTNASSDSTESASQSQFVTCSVNLERRVWKKMKAAVRDNRQFRSVSAYANYQLAKALGLEGGGS
jgi:hypothetical protein